MRNEDLWVLLVKPYYLRCSQQSRELAGAWCLNLQSVASVWSLWIYSGNSKSSGTGWFGVKAEKRGRRKKIFFPDCSYSRKIALDGELFCKLRAPVTGQSSLSVFMISLMKEFHNRNIRELKDRT